MKENKNIAFLNTIYQISEMGVIGINDVIDKVAKSEFREFLISQKEEYDKIRNKSKTILTSYGAEEKNLGKMAKVNSKIMSEMKLLKNKEDTVIAEMMIKGTTKGIEKINTAMNEYNEKDEEAFSLAKKLLQVLENNIKDLKIYL